MNSANTPIFEAKRRKRRRGEAETRTMPVQERRRGKLTPEQRLEMIERVILGGEKVVDVVKDYGISRTVFYRFLNRYEEAGRSRRAKLAALADKKPKIEVHPRKATPAQKRAVLKICVRYPHFSAHDIAAEVGIIGSHGVQRILERNGLNLEENRRRFRYHLCLTRPWQLFFLFAEELLLIAVPLAFLYLSYLLTRSVLVRGVLTPKLILGTISAEIALLAGTFFFLYSLKYYLTVALVLVSSRGINGHPNNRNGIRNGFGNTLHGNGLNTDLNGRNGNNHRLNGLINGIFNGRLNGLLNGINGLSPFAPRQARGYGGSSNGLNGLNGLNGANGNNMEKIKIAEKPFISIHLPFYNEKRVAGRILEACSKLNYPNFEVLVLDDSDDGTTQIVEEWTKKDKRIRLVHRPNREGWKGGALKYALKKMDPRTEFVVIFDADFIPFPDTLTWFLRYFYLLGANGHGSAGSPQAGNGILNGGRNGINGFLNGRFRGLINGLFNGRNNRNNHLYFKNGSNHQFNSRSGSSTGNGYTRKSSTHSLLTNLIARNGNGRLNSLVNGIFNGRFKGLFNGRLNGLLNGLSPFAPRQARGYGGSSNGLNGLNGFKNGSLSPNTYNLKPNDNGINLRAGKGWVERLKKSKIAAVQGYQWHVLNKDENWITRGVRGEYAGSYIIERSGTELLGSLKQIAGAVYMIRADVLKKFGWGTSITEDFQLTLRLYEAGYKVIYTPYIQGPAECVSTIKRLIRQRMRWAEGHTHNVRKMFLRLWRTPQMTWTEKMEFLYLIPYYLQSVFFLTGTFAWILTEVVFKVRLPFWTATWGWSLVFTNMFSLLLMNAVGLFIEESDNRDYIGLLSFVALTYLIAPFQAYAAIKGFLEKEEGHWFRTPKTGHITIELVRGHFARIVRWLLPHRAARPSVARAGTTHLRGEIFRHLGGVYPAVEPAGIHGKLWEITGRRTAFLPLNLLPNTSNLTPNFTIRPRFPRRLRWVSKAALAILLAISVTVFSLTRGIPEVLATNPGSTLYLRNEVSSVLTGTPLEWRLADASDTGNDSTTTIAVNNKLTAPLWFQYKPGNNNNSTAETAQTCAGNGTDNAGWILENQFGSGGYITNGTWTFYWNETDNRDSNVGKIQVCVWRVTVSGGVIGTSNLLFGATGTANHWDGLASTGSFTSSQGQHNIGPNEYLYIEYFSSLTTINSAGGGQNFTSQLIVENSSYQTRVVTPGIQIPENVVLLIAAAPFISMMVLWLRRRRGFEIANFNSRSCAE